MIQKEFIEKLISDKLSSESLFIVDLNISKKNKITLLLDGMLGVSIDQCVALSRAIEKGLNRDEEDFELEVSSPGLDSPFKVYEQYLKNINRELRIILSDGIEKKGILTRVDKNKIEIEVTKKVKAEGKKKKQIIKNREEISFDDIKSAQIILKI